MESEEQTVTNLHQEDSQENNDTINQQVNLIIDHYSSKLANTELELALTKSELEMLKREKGNE